VGRGPLGTLAIPAAGGAPLGELIESGERLCVARCGRGGRGNTRFATATNRAPRRADPGEEGEEREVLLELKLLADVGTVGLPNAGKSTLISRLSAATPKIADYPFTTLVPQVGIANIGDYDTLVIADLPGLIEGASTGTGLGHRFLKHVERCGVLLHLVDVSETAGDPVEGWRTVERELERSSPSLFAKPRLTVATKVESEDAQTRALILEEAVGHPIHRVSSWTGKGLPELLTAAQRMVRAATAR
jgi:GTP-binding protein